MKMAQLNLKSGHLKNRIKQAIYLRGSNDFQSLDKYRLLIEGAVAKLNSLVSTEV